MACGTGHLLIPIAKSGVKIDGLDTSEDMLRILRRKAAAPDLKGIKLYRQPMQQFALPQKYDAIFIAASTFQLLTSTMDALNCLDRVRDHLSQDGFFLVEMEIQWDDIVLGSRGDYRIRRDAKRPDGKRGVVCRA